MNLSITLAIIGSLVAILGTIIIPLIRLVSDINTRLKVVEFQMTILVKGFSFSAASALHSPHTEELDILLEKFQNQEINDIEIKELIRQLKKTVINNPKESAYRKKLAMDILTLITITYEVNPNLKDLNKLSISSQL